MRGFAVRGSDGDGEGGVAGIVDGVREDDGGLALLGGKDAIAGVARSDHDDDAALHEAVDFDTERALTAGEHLGVELIADAEIDAVDAEELGVAVELFADVGEGAHDVAGAALAIVVEDFEADEFALRSYAVE